MKANRLWQVIQDRANESKPQEKKPTAPVPEGPDIAETFAASAMVFRKEVFVMAPKGHNRRRGE
jgi:hypothetical protein